MNTFGFLGCGNLAQSLIEGALSQKLLVPGQVLISNRTKQKSLVFSQKTGVSIARDNAELIFRSDYIFVGIKPYEILPALEQLSKENLKDKVVISLATGVEAPILLKYCNGAKGLFRVMANTPATIQKGLFGLYPIKSNQTDTEFMIYFFSGIGKVVELGSDQEVNYITAGSASGVGLIFSLMEDFEKWFLSKGMSKTAAREIAVETFLGASELAKIQSGQSIARLREAVTSKKGTTLAGLNALKRARVSTGLRSGLQAALKRSQEIAKSLLRTTK